MKYYIAYGSNLNIPQMRQRCPDAEILGIGQLEGWVLQLRGSWHRAYFTIEPAEGSTVPVAVWQVSEKDEVSLDDYEGYPTLYYKRNLQVTCRDGKTDHPKTVDAFVYIMDESYPLAVPTEDYMSTCMEGYDSFHFPPALLQTAYQRAWIAAEKALDHTT